MVLRIIYIVALTFFWGGAAYCPPPLSQEEVVLSLASVDSPPPLSQETATSADSQEDYPAPAFKTQVHDLLFPFETTLYTRWTGHHRFIASAQVGFNTLKEILPSIPSLRQTGFVFLLNSLITEDPNPGALLSAIQTLKEVPACDRLQAMERFAAFVTDDLTGQQRAIVLKSLQKVPEDKFEEYKAIADALTLPHMQSIDRAMIMEGLAHPPEGFTPETFLERVKKWWPAERQDEDRFKFRFALTRPPLLPRELKFR